jgi:transformation/transcription domain-associated protein
VFVRDELNAHLASFKKPPMLDSAVKEHVASNVDILTRRASALACPGESEKSVVAEGGVNLVPANQTILDLISQAVNPLKLAQMDLNYIPSL